MKKTKLNISELKGFLRHIVSNNRVIQQSGKIPTAVEVVGESGIGKTSTIIQLAKELGLDCVKINLSQTEELGDLVGIPIKQYEIERQIKTSDVSTTGPVLQTQKTYIDENILKTIDLKEINAKLTGKTRMSYAAPEWIANKTHGGMLILDDYNRAQQRFLQATMEIIDRQEYISWKLPKDWHIVLTCNPEGDDYAVESLDAAQKTRFISVDLEFDVNCWARWAEEEGIDTRCINFLLLHPELVKKETNARSIVTFFNSISSFDSFEEKLPIIRMIGEGSVGTEFTSLFIQFINNKLDKLLKPEYLVLSKDPHSTVLTRLEECIKDKNTQAYRADIASVLATRVINFSIHHFGAGVKIEPEHFLRLEALIVDSCFTKDLKYIIVNTFYKEARIKFQKLFMNTEIIKMMK